MNHTRRIVILGKTGSGKSSLGNTIFGKDMFSVSDSPNSETKTSTPVTRPVRGRSICLIDTPGLFDTDPNSSSHSQAILKCMEACDPGPHAFLLVLKVERYTQQEEAVVDIILQYFSEEALKYTTVVFTHGADLRDKRIGDWVSQNEKLSELVQKCGGRCHVFDNTHWNNSQHVYRNNQKQVQQLLNTIDRTVAQNGGTYYTIGYWQTIKNYRQRFREAPVGVKLAVFFGVGVGVVGALIVSKVPWTTIMEMVREAAQSKASGAVWVCKQVPAVNKEMATAIEYLATLSGLFTQINRVHDTVRPVGASCTVL